MSYSIDLPVPDTMEDGVEVYGHQFTDEYGKQVRRLAVVTYAAWHRKERDDGTVSMSIKAELQVNTSPDIDAWDMDAELVPIGFGNGLTYIWLGMEENGALVKPTNKNGSQGEWPWKAVNFAQALGYKGSITPNFADDIGKVVGVRIEMVSNTYRDETTARGEVANFFKHREDGVVGFKLAKVPASNVQEEEDGDFGPAY